MIGYIIISKPLIALVLNLTAVFNVPWGPHFGLALTLNAKVDEILLQMLVQPAMPPKLLEILQADAIGKPKKAAETANKIDRIKEREDHQAREILKQSDNAKEWCTNFVNTDLEATVFDESNPAQKAASDYALAMGLPSSGSAISDNYGRYCRTFAGYVSGKAEAANDTTETDR